MYVFDIRNVHVMTVFSLIAFGELGHIASKINTEYDKRCAIACLVASDTRFIHA